MQAIRNQPNLVRMDPIARRGLAPVDAADTNAQATTQGFTGDHCGLPLTPTLNGDATRGFQATFSAQGCEIKLLDTGIPGPSAASWPRIPCSPCQTRCLSLGQHQPPRNGLGDQVTAVLTRCSSLPKPTNVSRASSPSVALPPMTGGREVVEDHRSDDLTLCSPPLVVKS
jgi:hypothetical protein